MKHIVSMLGVAAIMAAGFPAAAVEEGSTAIRNRTIAYAMTTEEWAMFKTPGAKTECPNGMNEGPREQFKVQFPEGSPRTVVGTQLAREADVWFPAAGTDQFPFKEVSGKVGLGLNLDGKTGPNDFTSPDGKETGIDNQFYRAIGCIGSYRDVAALMIVKWRQDKFNRVVIELTDVDSLSNDDDVTVTTYRGLNALLPDATGAGFMPGGTQKLDLRFGKPFIQKFKGRIKDGVLTTEGADYEMPYMALQNVSTQLFRGLRFQLRLSPDSAEGYMGGYVDIESWQMQRNESIATHHQSYGQESAGSLYRALLRLADGYPDPKTGKNTAISSALAVRFTQVFTQHPPRETAEDAGAHRAAR